MTDRELLSVPYERLVGEAADATGTVCLKRLTTGLSNAWVCAYTDACQHAPTIMEFQDGGFTFLFDQASLCSDSVEDRLVAAYGLSAVQQRPRDASRIRGFLGGRIEIPEKGVFDKGHVLAHGMGGGLDVNLFPQRLELNRGRSARGKIYRKMESYAVRHPGTLAFSHLIYSDESWVPAFLEYGVLMDGGKIWVERFAN